MSEQNKKIIKTKVGGQALIEGVMMLGPKKGCIGCTSARQGDIHGGVGQEGSEVV